ncbi:ribonucleotide reductase inhibitor domain-containing protein [Hirsutella rhossiliensis]|uniref:Ribonucleotide reductase inhibitor domain-containing protein n=1 Tax=Hirsutella rhossiliensis TaxID=111463 RepID=A0A9P8MV87_9HYPO|nr:ribonucleotide reductase inhibitor domain-containing protein [Hirsutella rhossiliensis]KAH0961860.1 ribonucleotide reductase inhibitor domain-containing protein [Hirsutella rhossiliensis]
MSAPRTKRPFAGAAADPYQRQITSFFPASAAGPSSPSATAPASRHPVLPASVQANLLSVGMRVRKSVPEGYRTTGPSAFKLWTDMPRELLPFCGINKVGGLGTQPETGGFDDDDVPNMDAVPGLTLSQESVESHASEPSRKRIFDDDDDDDAASTVAGLHSNKGWDANSGNARLMATPRRSRTAKSLPLEDMGQENMAVDEDFEEAPFLVFGEGRDMDLSR